MFSNAKAGSVLLFLSAFVSLVAAISMMTSNQLSLYASAITEDDGYTYPDNASDEEKEEIDEREQEAWEDAGRPGEIKSTDDGNDGNNNDDDNDDDKNKISSNSNSESSSSIATKTIFANPNSATTTQTLSSQEQTLAYDNPDYNISMQYPSNWTPSEVSLAPYQAVKFVAPAVEERQTPTFIAVYTPATLGIAVRPLDSVNVTSDQFIDQFFETSYT